MRGLTGLPKNSKISTADALNRILLNISDKLQKKHRGAAKREQIALREAWDRQESVFAMRFENEGWQINHAGDLDEEGCEVPFWAEIISDAFAGHPWRSEEERDKARKGALTNKSTGLILASSQVEPALDGLHAGGRYRTRTKGSPLVRYELPTALEKFNPRGTHQPSRGLLLAALKS
jgi:hypothetical protein